MLDQIRIVDRRWRLSRARGRVCLLLVGFQTLRTVTSVLVVALAPPVVIPLRRRLGRRISYFGLVTTSVTIAVPLALAAALAIGLDILWVRVGRRHEGTGVDRVD